jgi:ABC-type transport system involved in multi-copper enzyme maturation permease subunit
MHAHLRAELIKLTTTRGVYGTLAGAVAVVMLATWSTLNQLGDEVSGSLVDQPFFFINAINLAAFAAVLGARSATEDFRHGTIIGAVLTTRRRGTVLDAKAVVSGLAGATLAVTAQAVMTGIAVVMTAGNAALQITARDVAAMSGITVAVAAWAVIGTAVGTAVRHQVAAVVGVVIWILVVENLGSALIGEAGRYLPGQAGFGVAGLPGLLPPPTAGLLLVLWAGAVLVTARVTLARRDV